jgi:hypothetical protein
MDRVRISRPLRTACLLSLSLLALSCAPTPPATGMRKPLQETDYPGKLIDSASLPDGLFLRQRIEARFGKRSLAFSAVLQTDGDVLSLLALTPYGSRAFLIAQRGLLLSFTAYVDEPLPFPPRFILLDVHRTLFLGIPGAPQSDGLHHTTAEGEQITESWKDGRLLERSFERQQGKPEGTIRIVYRGGMRGTTPPERIDLDNGWFGYHLVIHTLPSDP